MKIGQRGTARNGQTGTVVEVYTNAVLFQSDTGAKFTLLTRFGEFTPDSATRDEKREIARNAKSHFAHVKAGFHAAIKYHRGRIIELFVRGISHGYVTPTKPLATGAFLAWYDSRQRVPA